MSARQSITGFRQLFFCGFRGVENIGLKDYTSRTGKISSVDSFLTKLFCNIILTITVLCIANKSKGNITKNKALEKQHNILFVKRIFTI